MFELRNFPKADYSGVISFQTLSWLPDYKKPLIELISVLNPSWIAFSSLFYDGPVNCKIEVELINEKVGDNKNKKSFYNVYAITEVKQFLEENGYYHFEYIPFEIDIDLKKQLEGMGTYTEKLEDGRRLQLSGPLLMPWHFICALKN